MLKLLIKLYKSNKNPFFTFPEKVKIKKKIKRRVPYLVPALCLFKNIHIITPIGSKKEITIHGQINKEIKNSNFFASTFHAL